MTDSAADAPDPSVELLRTLTENLHGSQLDEDWVSFAMVLELDDGDLAETYGYAYAADGTVMAVSARSSWVRPAVLDYLQDYFGPDGRRPVKLLVQYLRPTGAYRVTFEDDDTARWTVTPANYRQLREELRPDPAHLTGA